MWLTPVTELEAAASKGTNVADFIEQFCTLTTTTVAGEYGEPLVLRDWQRELLTDLFAIDPETKLRRFRRAYIGMPRKNGKSALGACIALYELFLGEPGAEIYSVAADRNQAALVFNMAKTMVLAHPELAQLATVHKNVITVESTNSIYRVISAEADRAEGLNPSLVIFDEVHTQPNDRLWNTMSLGSGARREPLMLAITTAGVRTDTSGDDSIAYRLYQYGRRLVAGEVDDRAFYFRWWEPAKQDCDHLDPAAWGEANPGYSDLNSYEDFVAQSKTIHEAEFRTKRLNQWVNTKQAWLPTGVWDDLTAVRPVPDATPVVLGFDGSYSGDSTGLVGCTLDGHLFVIDAWEKPAGADSSWRVDISAVMNAIRAACGRYDVQEVVCDPFRWAQQLQTLSDEGYPMLEYPNSNARMIPATARFYDACTNGLLSHDGNSDLARHISNAVVKMDAAGQKITKDTKNSNRKIDLAICAVTAYDRVCQVVPVQPRRHFIY